MTLRDWLHQQFPNAKGVTLKRMVEQGRVLISGNPARTLKQPIVPTDRVTLQKSAKPAQPTSSELKIVYEDVDILVVDKPAGLLTSTNTAEKRPTLLAMVKAHVARHHPRALVGLIHRLDRAASGLLIFSKNPAAYDSLKSQFFHHTVQRQYIAIVQGKPRQTKARLKSYLVELPDGEVVSKPKPGKGKLAITDVLTLQTIQTPHGERSMLQVTLQTGRKHQIRTQLSQQGTPIVNDPIYNKESATGRMMLVAVLLGIPHPRTGKPMKWQLPMPREFKHAMTPTTSA